MKPNWASLVLTLSLASVAWATGLPEGREAAPSTIHNSASKGIAVAAFAAQRHPDTIEAHAAYKVAIQQLSGPDAVGGDVEYSIWNSRGKKTASEKAELSNLEPGKWIASIPGQPVGSVVRYHYVLLTRTGVKLRHPSSLSADYRFRIVPLRLLSLSVEKSEVEAGKKAEVVVTVESASAVEGEIVLRLLPSSSKGDLHIDLLREQRAAGADGPLATMRARLPVLLLGQAADFYFRLHNQNGDSQTLPEEAPAQVYSVKRPVSRVQCIPVKDRFVLGAVASGAQRWVSLNGGGVWGGEVDSGLRHWSTCQGIFSNITRFAAPDPEAGNTYVGNDHGVVVLGSDADIPLTLLRPEPSAWDEKLPSLARLGRSVRAGPAALSPLDGTLLFQFQREHVLEEHYPLAVFFQLDAGRLTQYSFPTAGRQIVGLSSATFDAVAGCWLLGALVTDSQESLSPIVVRRCGDSVQQILLPEFRVRDSRCLPQRIIALARDPATGGLAIALEFQVSKGRPQASYGVFRILETSGELTAVAQELSDTETEITSLAADWSQERILVGTFGDGLWEIRAGKAHKLEFAETISTQITTVNVDVKNGRAIIGTSDGAYESFGGLDRISSLVPSNKDALPGDSLPMDVNATTGAVLFSSYSAGLAELQKYDTEEWHFRALLQGGRQLRDGHFGDAQFTNDGGLAAVLYSSGLLLADDKETRVLGPAEGLYSTNLFRLLTLRSGQLWVAYTPLAFGRESQGAIQLLKGKEIAQTFKMPDRGSATIGRWIEVPERNCVFAATPAGVVEIRGDGTVATMSPNPASSIARSPVLGLIGAVGSAIERWDGQKFVPVFYQVEHARWPMGTYQPGSPTDIAIDSNGMWYVLYRGGVLVILNRQGRFFNLLDSEDGVPATAQRLMAIPGTGDVVIGTMGEGVVIVDAREKSGR